MKKAMALCVAVVLVSIGSTCFSDDETLSDVTEQVRLLMDKDRIIRVINTLFISTDARDWPKVKDCFSSKVLFDMTSMTGGDPITLTPQEIVDSWEKGLRALKAIHHQAGNYVVDIHKNDAEAFCYGIASHYLPNETNENTRTFVGSYNFRLARDGGNWKIREFKFNLKYIDGNPNLEAGQ